MTHRNPAVWNPPSSALPSSSDRAHSGQSCRHPRPGLAPAAAADAGAGDADAAAAGAGDDGGVGDGDGADGVCCGIRVTTGKAHPLRQPMMLCYQPVGTASPKTHSAGRSLPCCADGTCKVELFFISVV